MKGLVTREMAIEQCIADAKAGMDLVLSCLYNEDITYVDIAPDGKRKLINNLIAAKWSLDFPEDFVVARCTNEDDYRKAQANNAYKWYIIMLNGEFDPSDSYGLSDKIEHFWCLHYEMHNPNITKDEVNTAWKKEFRSRLDKIINDILNSTDIRIYAMNHIKP